MLTMRQKFGETRSSIRDRHALISPDSHERTIQAHWPDSLLIFVITPQMGAEFTQYFAEMPDGAEGWPPLPGVERFVFVLGGGATLSVGGEPHELGEEGYALVPADVAHSVTAKGETRLVVYERVYLPLEGRVPDLVVGNVADVVAAPMKGDDMLMLQKLIPERAEYDCEFNIMDFSPGASLPYVETHYMEHGLLMLNGGGVYRLDNCWYPVEGGDVIWMGPYCGQWFCAVGRSNARYLIYKNWNRDPLTPERES
jgi:(S)-ureidoglycine aminohydrolase